MAFLYAWIIIAGIFWATIVASSILDQCLGGPPTISSWVRKHKYKIFLGVIFWPITLIVYPFINWRQ